MIILEHVCTKKFLYLICKGQIFMGGDTNVEEKQHSLLYFYYKFTDSLDISLCQNVPKKARMILNNILRLQGSETLLNTT